MNERQLSYVVAAVETGSFTQAAARCLVSQPSLSASIARLERELGVLLFHRVGRTIAPTDACTALLPSARDAMRAVDGARRAVDAVRSGLAGELQLGVQPTVVASVIELLHDFRSRHPGVTIRMRSPGDDESIAGMVASGRAELGVGDIEPHPALAWTAFRTESYVLVGTGDAGPDRPARRVGDLVDTPLVVPPRGSPTRAVIDALFAAAGVVPEIVMEVDHRDALLPLVAVGAGATIVPGSMVDGHVWPSLPVSALAPPVERGIGIARRDAALTPAAQALLRSVEAGTDATEGRGR